MEAFLTKKGPALSRDDGFRLRTFDPAKGWTLFVKAGKIPEGGALFKLYYSFENSGFTQEKLTNLLCAMRKTYRNGEGNPLDFYFAPWGFFAKGGDSQNQILRDMWENCEPKTDEPKFSGSLQKIFLAAIQEPHLTPPKCKTMNPTDYRDATKVSVILSSAE